MREEEDEAEQKEIECWGEEDRWGREANGER